MKVHILGDTHSIFNQFMAELRDAGIQKDRLRFRKNLERIGHIFAFEISKELTYGSREIKTPLGSAEVTTPEEWPVVATILRAGLPLHDGITSYFDKSDSAFVSAYRNHKNNQDDFDIEVEYLSSPDLTGKVLILCDTMLATGQSMVEVFHALRSKGRPSAIHIVSAIASTEGINYLQEHLPPQVTYWMGAVDEELTAQAYIVPGLGDAGDLAFGIKDS